MVSGKGCGKRKKLDQFCQRLRKGVYLLSEIHAFNKIYAIPKWNLRERRVFLINMVIVMGPTPPGTGVI